MAVPLAECSVVRIDDAYLPLIALAKYAGLGVRTLRGYLVHPVRPLPYFRIGGKILVRRSDFDAWAKQFQHTAPTQVDAIVADMVKGL